MNFRFANEFFNIVEINPDTAEFFSQHLFKLVTFSLRLKLKSNTMNTFLYYSWLLFINGFTHSKRFWVIL